MIYGRSLTHRHKTEAERVEDAVAILEGRASVVAPCLLQVARQCNVSPVKLRAALRRRNGKPSNGRNGHAETLAQHIKRSSLAERLEAACAVGIDVIWDTMISPVIVSEAADINTNA
jgi:hypothetical protein